jgi:hypothetical protein
VLAQQLKEAAVLFLKLCDDLKLLQGRRVGECIAKTASAHFIGLRKAGSIRVLKPPIVARELAIDVCDHPGLRGAGKFVSGDDLIAKSGENACLVVAQKIPRGTGAMVAADDRSRATESTSQCKLPSS